jgi:STAS domain
MSFGPPSRLFSEMPAPHSGTIDCDVSALTADVHALHALARLQLTARRHGVELRLRHASRELEDLLVFAGLRDALRVETGGHAEQGEQRLGVEEERELDDPSA